ncbi:MAG: type II toxin-antitoxin system RelE/ParE family toxin [Acidobacteria bacterium]|nr:type II toxin-antitoxin system RelE/ParE family toxin [Acidobacteriota bacterium]
MAYRLVWSESASGALVRATEFIAQDSPRHAEAFRLEAVSASRSLAHSPLRGRLVPEMYGSAIREVFVRSYRLIYRVEADRVVILRFIHGARDLATDSTIYSQS